MFEAIHSAFFNIKNIISSIFGYIFGYISLNLGPVNILLFGVTLSCFHSIPPIHQGRDTGNDFLFPIPSPFLKLNNNDVKSFLNGYPIF